MRRSTSALSPVAGCCITLLLRDHSRLVDFKGKTSREDRKRLLLRRLFENRGHFADEEVSRLVAAYAAERVRLLYPPIRHRAPGTRWRDPAVGMVGSL